MNTLAEAYSNQSGFQVGVNTYENQSSGICDVAIIGAGIVGTSLALALSHRLPELKITVLEATSLLTQSSVEYASDSPLSLNLASCLLFQRFDFWDSLAALGQPIAQLQISEQGRFGKMRIHAKEDMASPLLGRVFFKKQLTALLQAQLCALGARTENLRMQHQKLVGLQKNSETRGWQLTLDNQQGHAMKLKSHTLQAALIIAADGQNSEVRQKLHIPVFQEKGLDLQAALSAWIITSKAHQQTAYERFTSQGVLALLPMGERKMGLVWAGPAPMIANLSQISEQAFLEQLQCIFGYRVGRFLQISTRSYHPILINYTQQPEVSGVVLMGSAAYNLHPLGAQALNLSLQDIEKLVAVLIAHVGNQAGTQLDLSTVDLKAYWQERLPQQHKTRRLINSIYSLFQLREWPFPWARSSGLWWLDKLSPLKGTLARRFMT